MSIGITGWPAIARPVSPLLRLVSRLRDITGFVTVYGGHLDQRVDVFARLWHVRRTVAVARRLARQWRPHDGGRVLWLAWLHDLNRWPFAHNTELGKFDQAGNTRLFFASHPGVGVTDADCEELSAIQRKDLQALSQEGQLLLIADLVAGVVEDCLMLICGLNARPELIPPRAARLFGFRHAGEPWRARQKDLAALLHGNPRSDVVPLFQRRFRTLFLDQVTAFLDQHRRRDPEYLADVAQAIKRTFVRPIVFPINNELVCHAGWLRREVIDWYLQNKPEAELTRLTEPQFVALATADASLGFTESRFLPSLDAICRSQRDDRFVRCLWPHER